MVTLLHTLSKLMYTSFSNTARPRSRVVDVKVINKSEKEAVSEETVKSEDGFKPADNADTTEDSTETINLEEVK